MKLATLRTFWLISVFVNGLGMFLNAILVAITGDRGAEYMGLVNAITLLTSLLVLYVSWNDE